MGLKGMEKSVTELGGSIKFASSPDNGFKTTMEVQLLK
jgi:signal transduction histidine kinase